MAMSEVEEVKVVEQAEKEEKNPVLAKIDSLDMSDEMKEQMRFIHAHYTGKTFGFPVYNVKGIKINWKKNSLLAFFFGPLYYLVKGMWRKSITLISILLIVSMAFMIAEDYMNIIVPEFIYKLIGFLCFGYMAGNAYYDIYRKEVLDEKFWW